MNRWRRQLCVEQTVGEAIRNEDLRKSVCRIQYVA